MTKAKVFKTTIRVSRENRIRLDALLEADDRMDDIISRLLDNYYSSEDLTPIEQIITPIPEPIIELETEEEILPEEDHKDKLIDDFAKYLFHEKISYKDLTSSEQNRCLERFLKLSKEQKEDMGIEP